MKANINIRSILFEGRVYLDSNDVYNVLAFEPKPTDLQAYIQEIESKALTKQDDT